MGHLSSLHLGAVGISAMIFNFIYWNFGFLRMGTTGFIAQAYGANDRNELHQQLKKALLFALILSVIIFALQRVLLSSGIFLLNVPDDQVQLVTTYFSIRIYDAPATFLLYVLLGFLFGMQNALYPLFITLVINMVNILLSYYLVTYMNMDIKGVAYGTLVAQYLGLLFAALLVLRKYGDLVFFKTNIEGLNANPSNWIRFFKVNSDLFIRTTFLTAAFGFFYSQSASQGAIVLASNVILLQFLTWIAYGIDGFAFASESLVGKYYGAVNWEKMNRVIHLTFKWGAGVALVYTLLIILFGRDITALFTNDLQIVEHTMSNIVFLILLPLISFSSYMWDGVFIGLTATREMLQSMILSFLGYLILYYVLAPFSTHAIWLAFLIFLLLRGTIQLIYWTTKIRPDIRLQFSSVKTAEESD